MGPEAKKKLELMKSQLPPKEKLPDNYEADKERLKSLLGQLRGDMAVIYDLCIVQPKAVKEEFIQAILVENKEAIDTVMKLAKDDQIDFSYMGMDTKYLKGELTLVHPDTAKAEELQDQLDKQDSWQGSTDCTENY